MSKKMYEVEVSADPDTVMIYQPSGDETAEITLSKDQAPVLAEWILQAAGGGAPSSGGPKLGEVQQLLRLFERIHTEITRGAESDEDAVTAVAAISQTLAWVAGETDESPLAWYDELRAPRR